MVAGPSGSGKTLMLARMAQSLALEFGAEQVAVISYCDLRPGAWNQAQLLSTQSGVECYRATSMGALKLLLDDVSHRRAVLIDTAGVQTAERVQEIRSVAPQAQFHAVVPADASVATLRRLFAVTDGTAMERTTPALVRHGSLFRRSASGFAFAWNDGERLTVDERTDLAVLERGLISHTVFDFGGTAPL